MSFRLLTCLTMGVCVALCALVGAVEAQDHPPLQFNRDIRPILSQNCFKCHGQDDTNREAGLRLDRREIATAELDSGETAIVPGRGADSELARRITSDDADMRMPPEASGRSLTPAQIATLIRWIDEGAPYEPHWAFVPPVRSPLPTVMHADWPAGAIDRFVLARQEESGLSPSPQADRHVLIRRLSLDLRGIPPSPDEVEAFVANPNPAAYEELVDRFLADPAFGERWARVWLDLARYADSAGLGSDPLRTIWPYRDWVIDSLNAGMPFDQFTIEQLAGDMLADADLSQRVATAFHRNTLTNTEGGTDDEEFRVAAIKDRIDTTFQVWMGLTAGCAKCHSHKFDPLTQREYYSLFAIFNQSADADRGDESPIIPVPDAAYRSRVAHIDAQIARLREQSEKSQAEGESPPPLATGRFVRIELPGESRMLSLAEVEVFSGGKNVARDGKATQSSVDYDGPPERAIDGNTDGHYFNAKSTTHTHQEKDPWWEVDLGKSYAIERIVVHNRTDGNLQERLAGFRLLVLGDDRTAALTQADQPHPNPSRSYPASPNERIESQIAALEKSKPAPPTVPVMQELAPEQHRTTHLMKKGNFLDPGDVVEPAVPKSLNPHDSAVPDRLALARWLIARDNPLTARVQVNRCWSQLMGRGIVRSEEDFGTQGDLPTHPALLDCLAVELMDNGWNTKGLVRAVVTSQTYRQSSRVTPELLEKDPENRFLARAPRYRLEAEMVRDQALALSGLLCRKMRGPSVFPPQPPGLWQAAFNGERTWSTSTGEDRYRRGLYTFLRRTVPYPSMATFDAPSRETCTVRRVRTNTPLQAFVTLNDPAFVEMSQALARRIVREGGASPRERVAFAVRLCYCRPARPEQVAPLLALYQSELAHYRDRPDDAAALATDPIGPMPDGADAAELAAWTVVANALLNTDAVLTRN